MGHYLPSTDAQRRDMLDMLGLSGLDDLYAAAPAHLILKDGPHIPPGKSELEVRRDMAALAAKNTVFPSVFRGAGAYRHYIPAIVSSVTAKETFLTAYTPYQAEVSQGVLQSIFEYQTMICELTGMDVSNASVYDGASAAAEAVAMCRDKKRTKALVSAAAHPDVIETIRTYCWGAGAEMALIPAENGSTDMKALTDMLDVGVSCVYIQQPNYFGVIEDADAIGEAAHAAGAKYIMGINPIAAALLKTPGECGADVAVGEGQPLGMPLAFGGPYLGFMAATSALMRKLPGRIVGQTADAAGRRAFVLTLQAREQHIRREKASSNICSNQALCAMTAAAYMAAMGPGGLRDVARQCLSKAHYLAGALQKLGFGLVYQKEYFHEFVTICPCDSAALLAYLESRGVLGGLPVGDGILWCATEMNSKADMDVLAGLIDLYLKGGARA
ncbi:MAG: aminomethyl-transferring glycine dehydrogenase subunit GcvPA [Oscillospiraceae bacterium]|jgi:glycine dehydrogenase subunit 1|nr:aminomethyl-transferring glycine dehydrogenase subunit GcvPA [Oscillospiraceae bacterium]